MSDTKLNSLLIFSAQRNMFVLLSPLYLYNSAFLHSPHQPVYTATKHGVIGFTRAMAVSNRHTNTVTKTVQKVIFSFCRMGCPPGSSKLSGLFHMFFQDASTQGDYGVRINVLCPAFVDTPLLHSVEHEDNMGKFVKFKDDFKRSMI